MTSFNIIPLEYPDEWAQLIANKNADTPCRSVGLVSYLNYGPVVIVHVIVVE